MYRTEFLPILKIRLRICKIWQCVPFEFGPTSKKLVMCRSHRQIRMFQLQCILSVVYCTAQFTNLCIGPLTKMEKLQGFGFFMTYFVATMIRWNYHLDNGPGQIINTFLDFEESIASSK